MSCVSKCRAILSWITAVFARFTGEWRMTRVDDSEFLHRYRSAVRDLATRLRGHREAQGQSQEQVAHDAGISVQTYSCLERSATFVGGKANPTLETIMRVFAALELDPLAFVGPIDQQSPGRGDLPI